MNHWKIVCAATACLFSLNTYALNFEWGDIEGSLHNKASIGASWRMEEIDYSLVGKVNVPGQEAICDAAPAQGIPTGGCTWNQADLRNAEGSYYLNGDNGNRSFQQYDVVAAAAKLRTHFDLEWGNFSLSGQTFVVWDPVNQDAPIINTNNFDNGGFQPAERARSQASEGELGFELALEQLNVNWLGDIGDHEISVSIGSQRLAWGESLTFVAHSINSINAPDLVRLNTPGFEVEELFDPVELINIGFGVTENLNASFVYQYKWRPVRVSPAGSFFSSVDIAGSNAEHLILGMGNNRESPHNLGDLPLGGDVDPAEYGRGCLADPNDPNGPNNPGAHRGDLNDPLENPGSYIGGRAVCHVNDVTARDDGQFGINLGYYAEWLNDTQFGFSYMNYHSRFPYLALYGTQDPPASATALPPLPGLPLDEGLRITGALKVADTLRYTLAYPEDIELYGISFNTVIGDMSVSGELAYRPNMPLLVAGVDVIFAGLANGFDSLRCVAAPSYIEEYRNGPRGANCDSAPPAPGEYIEGWEEHEVMQGVLGLINAESSNPFGADRWLQVLEIGFVKVMDMPAFEDYQLHATGLQTHASLGRDEVDADGNNARDVAAGGTNVGVDVDVIAMQNPTRQTDGFATSLSWGYHLINVLEYKNLFWGVNTQAIFLWFHDVKGTSPAPGGNFLEGKKRATLLGRFDYGDWGASAGYTWQFDGGVYNDISDRDTFSMSFSYRF